MKKHLRVADGVFIIAILITLLACPGLYAAEETLPTPEEIIAKNIEAIGGINALKKIKNKKIVISYKNFQSNEESKITSYQERPSKLIETLDGRTVTYGSDGKIAWSPVPSIGAYLTEGDELSDDLIMDSFDGPDGPDVRYKSMKTEGIERVNGKACYKVVKTPEKGNERTVYYDKNDFMIVKEMAYRTTPRGHYIREIYYEEYQEINNILFPYKRSVFLRGQKFNEATFEKIDLNIEMSEGIFDIPEEVKAVLKQKQTGVWKKYDGAWKGTVLGPDGNPMDITYVFDSSGYNLKGSVSTKFGGGSFYGCKIEGNNISFSVHWPDATVHLNGTLSGDVLNMTQKNGDEVKEFKLNRVTE